MATQAIRDFAFFIAAGVGLLAVPLMTASSALAQMGVSNNGVVFPDGSIQTTAAAAPGTITEYRIVGFTTATSDGQIETTDSQGGTISGVVAMNQLCADEFGSSARAAFTREQLAPNVAPSTAPEVSWIRPTSRQVVFLPDASSGSADWQAMDSATAFTSFADISPQEALGNLNCSNWYAGSSAVRGMARLVFSGFSPPLYAFGSSTCDTPAPIACSAPVQITSN